MPENSNMISNSADAAVGSATAAANSANISDSNIESLGKNAAAESGISVQKESDIPTDEKKLETPSKNEVINKINECDNLVTAVESVAAMYCIPSSYIVEDPITDRIAVTKGHIVVPSNSTSKPSENGKVIIQSIGALLDYISQRADDKLNQFQADNIRDGINKEKVAAVANPSKGKVVATQFDANGDPVVVYDSGLADMENTKEAQETYDNMKLSGNAPEYKGGTETPSPSSYFTAEEDDITGGQDISGGDAGSDAGDVSAAGSGPETDTGVNDSTSETNVSADIKEEG